MSTSENPQASLSKEERLTADELAALRDLVPMGFAVGIGGKNLARILDHIESQAAHVIKLETENSGLTTAMNRYSEQEILCEQTASPPAVIPLHLREPPHCPSCDCGPAAKPARGQDCVCGHPRSSHTALHESCMNEYCGCRKFEGASPTKESGL